jgi:hypothetical protein
MLELREIQLEDKPWILELLSYSDFRGCEYSFGNNFVWRKAYNMKMTRYKDFYISFGNGHFFFPAGRGDIEEVIAEMNAYSNKYLGEKLFLSSMSKNTAELLKSIYGEKIILTPVRDNFDYIYSRLDLAELKGKKYHSKRNHINRFKENNWTYEPITPDNIHECLKMNEIWCERNGCLDDESKNKEACAVRQGLTYFFDIGFVGGLIRVDGKIQAFTYGEKQNSDTFVVHVEKALTDYQGAYPMINNQFILHECGGYEYINREEDMGEKNLRKAKLSYHPVFFEEKFQAQFL